MELLYINNDELVSTKYKIKFLRGNICFIKYLKEESSKTPSHELSAFPNFENKNNTLASYPTKPHAHEGTANKGECTSVLYYCAVNKEIINRTKYEHTVRHIAKQK